WSWTHAVPFNASEYRGLHCLRLLSSLQAVDFGCVARDCVAALACACTEPAPPCAAPRSVTLMPGGGAGEFKKWGLARYLALADALAAQGPTHFHIVLGPAEASEAALLHSLNRSDVSVLNAPSLPALAATIMCSDLVVAND